MANGTITLNPIADPQENASFTISGTLAVTPLTYKDDSGVVHAMTTQVITAPFSFSHAGLPAGSHTVTVSDALSGASANVAVTVKAPAPPPSTLVTIGANQSFTTANGTVYRIDGELNGYRKLAGGSETSLGELSPIGWNVQAMAYDAMHPIKGLTDGRPGG
jgi:hypothetical protein